MRIPKFNEKIRVGHNLEQGEFPAPISDSKFNYFLTILEEIMHNDNRFKNILFDKVELPFLFSEIKKNKLIGDTELDKIINFLKIMEPNFFHPFLKLLKDFLSSNPSKEQLERHFKLWEEHFNTNNRFINGKLTVIYRQSILQPQLEYTCSITKEYFIQAFENNQLLVFRTKYKNKEIEVFVKGYFFNFGNFIGYYPKENIFFYIEIEKGEIKVLDPCYIIKSTNLQEKFKLS